MKKALSVILALMMVCGCFCFGAAAENFVNVHFFADQTVIDRLVDDEIQIFNEFVEGGERDKYKEYYPTRVGEDGKFLRDVCEAEVAGYAKVPSVLVRFSDMDSYDFAADEDAEGWAIVSLPVGLDLTEYEINLNGARIFNLGAWGVDVPTALEDELWIVMTVKDDKIALVCSDTAPECWDDGLSGNTDITASVPDKSLAYTIVIPESASVSEENHAKAAVGVATVTDVVNASTTTRIYYTAEGSDFVYDGISSITMAADYSYDCDSVEDADLDGAEVVVYRGGEEVESTVYVSVEDSVWNTARPGSYSATVTFSFDSYEAENAFGDKTGYLVSNAHHFDISGLGEFDKENVVEMALEMGLNRVAEHYPELEIKDYGYDEEILNGDFVILTIGNYIYYTVDGGWAAYAKDRSKTSYGALLDSIAGMPLVSLNGTFSNCNNLIEGPAIPRGVVDVTDMYSGCAALVNIAGDVPASVRIVRGLFYGCASLNGEIEFNCTVLRDHMDNAYVFTGAAEGENRVTLTGSAPVEFLEYLADQNDNVSVDSSVYAD